MAGTVLPDSRIIGARIREERIKKGMSQAELAGKSNISLPHISDIELGKSKMMLSSFIRITEALQVSADMLIRSDVPEVKSLYQNELAEILDDCTPAEIDALLKIVTEIKQIIHRKEE